jgi:hypothetical protein
VTRRTRVAFQILVPAGLAVAAILVFPGIMVFVEGAALSLRRFWWLVLIVAMGSWLAWMLSKRNR